MNGSQVVRGKTLTDRFWEKVDKTDGCWTWNAGKTKKGYGGFSVDGKFMAAHRVSYELDKGPIPEGLWVLHKCDNPPCVRPEHLFAGTPRDNVKDMVSKGRGSKKRALGEDNGKSVLTSEQALAIYSSTLSQRKTAALHGCSRGCVKSIKEGRSWTHVTQKDAT